MPDYEPNPDAPTTYWAGEYDAQAIADATGASWAAPIFALHQPRIVNIADLCSGPPPSAPVFTTTDLVLSMNIFADNTALRQKLSDYVDAGLHRSFCTAVDVPPLPPMPANPPPSDLPDTPTPPVPSVQHDVQMRDVWNWLEWLRRQILSRDYHEFYAFSCTDTGSASVASHTGDDWEVWAAGVRIKVETKPDFVGRANGGEPTMYWDLGWMSLGYSGSDGQPFRIQRENQIVWDQKLRITRVTWTLLPGVELSVWPLYPTTVFTSE